MSQVETILYRAPLVAPVAAPLIEDGALLVAGGTIQAVGRFADLQATMTGLKVIDLEQRIIMPALINCHAHLELSWMAALSQRSDYFEPGDITTWIQALLAMRDDDTAAPEVHLALARQQAAKLHRSGVAVIADIGNAPASAAIAGKDTPEIFFFQELMGLSESAAHFAQQSVAESDVYCTAHGPYSCHATLIQFAKNRSVARGHLFPIHTAESEDEREFLQTGTGRFYDFLNERLMSIGEFQGQELNSHFTPPQCGSVAYLDRLGVLDAQTLCVHGVHVSDAEIELLAAAGAKVCLCPGSNRFLGVGRAPVQRYIDQGIVLGLGTDSLASNPELSIWREMQLLAADHPSVSPQEILRMATEGGAATLGIADRFGSLAPGRTARALAVEFEPAAAGQIFDYLVAGGHQMKSAWLREFDD